MKRDLPKRVYEKDGSYWHVAADGKKRIWVKLCRVAEGIPAMYRALSELLKSDVDDDSMPRVIADWMRDVASTHSKKTQADDTFRSRVMTEAFADFRACQVKPPDVTEFLKPYQPRPRTFNAYRSAVREIMRYAEERGFREPGSNPVDALRTMTVKARSRYITDSELRRIKVAAMFAQRKGDSVRVPTRSGPMLCALIDLAYLTGQRIGDLLTLEWSQIGRDGIEFAPSKVEGSTGVRILIAWTPRLRAVIERIKGFKRRHIRVVITTQEGQPYTYFGASIAWRRAVQRAVKAGGVKTAHFHDIRAKALTDKESRDGMQKARQMGGHSTEQQTSDYVRNKSAVLVAATR